MFDHSRHHWKKLPSPLKCEARSARPRNRTNHKYGVKFPEIPHLFLTILCVTSKMTWNHRGPQRKLRHVA